MATTQPLVTAPYSAHARPYDRRLSLALDDVILQLEAGATGLRRRWLLLVKRWHERTIPAWYPEVR